MGQRYSKPKVGRFLRHGVFGDDLWLMLPDTRVAAAVAAAAVCYVCYCFVGVKKMMLYASVASVPAASETRRHLPRAEPLCASLRETHLLQRNRATLFSFRE